MTGRRSDEELDEYLAKVLIGGAERRAIDVADHDSGWAQRFSREAVRIATALGDKARLIEHVGSTAVPGLAAKPIIDILLVVGGSADESSYLPALEAAGYVLRVREPEFHEHRMVRTPAKDVHVHIFSPDSPEIARLLTLRDRLRRSAADRELYARTKRRLAARSWPSTQHYAEAKTEVIEAILARATAAEHQDDEHSPPRPRQQ